MLGRIRRVGEELGGGGEHLGQGGELEHWGAVSTEHAAQGRPKHPVRGSWLRTLARGAGSRAPCRPAGVPCPSPAGPRPFLTYQGSGGGWPRRSCPRGWGWWPDGLVAVPGDGRARRARWWLQAHGLRPPLPRPEGREEGGEITLSERDRESP